MKFLIIDADAGERSLTIKALLGKFADVEFVEIGCREEFDETIAEADFNLAITEYRLGWTDGLTAFKEIQSHHFSLPVIMLTDSGNEDIAVTAIKWGMADYIVKSNRHSLPNAITRSLLEVKKREHNKGNSQFKIRDPFFSRFTPDFAYSVDISAEGKPIFGWITKPLRQLIKTATPPDKTPDWILPIHPEDMPIIQDRVKNIIATREDTSEYRVIISDTETRYFKDHSLPVRDRHDSTRIKSYCVIQDITSQRKDEEKLYLMQQAIDSSSNGIVITGLADKDYPIIYANAAFLNITGYTREEVLGLNCRFLQQDDRNQPNIAKVRAALQSSRDTHAILRNYRKNGDLFWNEFYISPIHNREGKITHYVGVLNDVTDRIEMEYALSTSEVRLRSIFNNVSDAIIIIDEHGIIEKLNPSAVKLFGYFAEELIGHNINKLMPEPDRSRHDSYLKNYLTSGKAKILGTRREVNGLRKDGEVFPMELGVSQFYDDHQHFFIGTVHDITERKKAEESLRDLSGHLERVREDERTRIAREIHDELGSLLTALKMDLSWLNKQLPPDLPLCHEKTAIMSRYLDDGIGSVRKIIADLRPTMLDHLGLLAAIDWKLDEFREQHDIHCVLTLPENDIVMDQNRDIAVFRIMQEALTNIALHAGASKVTINVEADADRLTMTITDNGDGMSKAKQHQPGKYGILGMHERARHFGGEITIVSNPGAGTTLMLNMPLKSPLIPLNRPSKPKAGDFYD